MTFHPLRCLVIVEQVAHGRENVVQGALEEHVRRVRGAQVEAPCTTGHSFIRSYILWLHLQSRETAALANVSEEFVLRGYLVVVEDDCQREGVQVSHVERLGHGHEDIADSLTHCLR